VGNEGRWDETVCAVKLPKCERLSCTNIVKDVVQIVTLSQCKKTAGAYRCKTVTVILFIVFLVCRKYLDVVDGFHSQSATRKH